MWSNGHPGLRDAMFHLTTGTTCALVDMNGRGKSALFRSTMGSLTPNLGQVGNNRLPVRTVLKQHLVAYVPEAEDVDSLLFAPKYGIVRRCRQAGG
jgi:manganese/iron transport system ATP-binding protein